MTLNLHALMLFHAIASTGSVTAASKKLKISQPAISAQIRSFERLHEVVLFEKKGRMLALTPLGQKLLHPTEQLFAIEEQIRTMLDDYHRHPQGKLRIAGNYLATSTLIPKWASLFKQKHPQIAVQIATVNSGQALESLLQYEADVAIFGHDRLSEDRLQSLHCVELFRDEFKFVTAPSHRFANQSITVEEVMKEPFIMREEGSATRKRLFEFCQLVNVLPPTIELEFNGLNETIQAVAAGYGLSFVSSIVANRFIRSGELAEVIVKGIKGVNTTNRIILATHKPAKLEHYVRDFSSIALRNRELD
ncbi:LysR family transcriptional regulator [Paenibacillus sp. NPDC058071]|uniref:LysR family transcriptional regulator n=1 Tax=Paenibacillus sp. NPDC058071 TaxID=3346326 RepID=UPI0036D7F12C